MFSQHVPPDHTSKNESFKQQVVPFVLGMAGLREEYAPRVQSVAGRITQLHGRGWVEKEEVRELWYALTMAATELSEHPHERKKMAAIIVDNDNRMVAWDVNRIPDGLTPRARYYVEKTRRGFIVSSVVLNLRL